MARHQPLEVKLTAAEAAIRLGRSRDEILRLARAGKLPSTREVGRRGVLEYRFRVADVEAYVPSRRGRPSAPASE